MERKHIVPTLGCLVLQGTASRILTRKRATKRLLGLERVNNFRITRCRRPEGSGVQSLKYQKHEGMLY